VSEGEVRVRGGGPSWVKVLIDFSLSSIGAKVLMALTGAALWGFLVVHLAGNLQQFTGSPAAMNEYGVFLRELGHGTALWIARAGLYLAFAVHIAMGLRLAALNRAARPVAYGKKRSVRTNVAALTMAVSGIAILVFLLVHLAHFTWGWILPDLWRQEEVVDGVARHDVFRMVWGSFKIPWVVGFYVVAQTLTLLHLYHGAVSLWQSLGLQHKVWSMSLRILGRALVGLIIVGNVAIPLAIFFSWPDL
jgi:succinate dehydrogenase / fumarate reductase, cytochrome b subunit